MFYCISLHHQIIHGTEYVLGTGEWLRTENLQLYFAAIFTNDLIIFPHAFICRSHTFNVISLLWIIGDDITAHDYYALSDWHWQAVSALEAVSLMGSVRIIVSICRVYGTWWSLGEERTATNVQKRVPHHWHVIFASIERFVVLSGEVCAASSMILPNSPKCFSCCGWKRTTGHFVQHV